MDVICHGRLDGVTVKMPDLRSWGCESDCRSGWYQMDTTCLQTGKLPSPRSTRRSIL